MATPLHQGVKTSRGARQGAPLTPATARATETILVAEDQEAVRTVVKRILDGRGYNVLVATNGIEAADIGRKYEGPIDLLVSDLVMPKMGGVALAELLGRDRPDMKVLLMSGYSDTKGTEPASLDGRICFIDKPFSVDELATLIRKMLDDDGACD